jgi:ligand-binding sensor domain-containing protein
MKLRVIAFLVLLFSTGGTLAPSQTSQSSVTSSIPTLDPTKRISQYAHTAWRFQDGVLPGPSAITQTTDGYLWIGASAGLVRFDGRQFVPWETLESQHLPDTQIASVLGARDGSLWIGTPKGVARWKDGELITFPPLGGKANSILEAHDGTIWIARIDVQDERGGICQVIGNEFKFYGKSDGVPFTSVNQIVEDGAGNLWLGAYQGLCRWNPESRQTYFEKGFKTGGLMGVWVLGAEKKGTVWTGAELESSGGGLELQRIGQEGWKPYQLPGIKGDPGVISLFVDRNQSLWIGTARWGIYRIHGNDVDHFDSSYGLSSNTISGFFEDREGTMWVATSKGVDSFRDVRVLSFSIREGLSTDSGSSVLAARDGSIWVGNSGALDLLKDGKLSAIRTGHGLPGRDVTTLFDDSAGRLWVGIDNELWVYDKGSFRSIDKGITFAITEDTRGVIWARIGERLDRIENLQVRERITLPQVTRAFKMAADPVSGIWLGLTNGDLVRYRDGQIETFPALAGLEYNIRALISEPDGSVWAATQEGLLRWKDGTSRLLTTHNNLSCNDIYSMVNDGNGSLWLYANCGVIGIATTELEKWWAEPDSKVNPRLLDIFDGAQPVLSDKQPQASRSPDGRLWFANKSILQMVDPNRLETNPIPPSVHIQRIVADRLNYSAKEKPNLPPQTRDLEIDYAALSLSIPQKVRYRYKLENHDQDWQEPGIRRQALYNDLPPGNYKFHVIACNSDGVWNEEGATVEFSITPAFYQTNWFILLCVAIVTGLVWAAYQWRVRWISLQLDRRFEERLAERTRIAQDLHDTLLQGVLSASMQLHVANDQLTEESPAKLLVTRVLELMGRVINEGRNALQGLRSFDEDDQDLDQAFSRVSQELTVNRAVDFRVIIEGQPCALHPMIRDEIYCIGREAIINAFRHSEATHIEAEIKYAAHDLHVMVRDNGCGIDEQVLRSGRDGHFGLSGMRERAERIGAKLKVWSRSAGGTEVELFIPGNVAFHTPSSNERRRWFTSLYLQKVEKDNAPRKQKSRDE